MRTLTRITKIDTFDFQVLNKVNVLCKFPFESIETALLANSNNLDRVVLSPIYNTTYCNNIIKYYK